MKAPTSISAVYDVDPFIATVAGTVDFSATTFTRPAGMAGMLAIMDKLHREGYDRKITLILPQSLEVKLHWHLTGISKALREFCDFDTEGEAAPSEDSSVKSIVACCHFRNESDIEQMLEEMENTFMSELKGYSSMLGECYDIFSELAGNIVYHAQSSGGLALAQQCNYDARPVIEIAVADSGIGIRNSLANNGVISGIDSDCDAIKRSLEEGVTSVSDSYRGLGLNYVANNVRLERNRSLVIRSYNGIIVLSGDGIIREENTDIAYPGTLVSVTIPL